MRYLASIHDPSVRRYGPLTLSWPGFGADELGFGIVIKDFAWGWAIRKQPAERLRVNTWLEFDEGEFRTGIVVSIRQLHWDLMASRVGPCECGVCQSNGNSEWVTPNDPRACENSARVFAEKGYDRLAAYNGERAMGITHPPEVVATMTELQQQYDAEHGKAWFIPSS